MSLPKNKGYLYLLLVAILSFLTSCQYQFGQSELLRSYQTISILYAQGDQQGELTTEVIKQISSSGVLRYMNEGGDLTLKIKLVEWREENIDFRYDRKRSGRIKKSIIPTETRVNVEADISLIETRTGQIVRGPTRIKASAEFDHTYYSTHDKVNTFSLGQVNDIDAARDAVKKPLYRCLAERIVDYIANSW